MRVFTIEISESLGAAHPFFYWILTAGLYAGLHHYRRILDRRICEFTRIEHPTRSKWHSNVSGAYFVSVAAVLNPHAVPLMIWSCAVRVSILRQCGREFL